MFVDQTFDAQVSQDITAVNNKNFVTNPVLEVFDSSARLHQVWLKHKFELRTLVGVIGKQYRKFFGQMLSVDLELFDAGLPQMVNSESDQRLSKNGQQRFRPGVRERAKPCP